MDNAARISPFMSRIGAARRLHQFNHSPKLTRILFVEPWRFHPVFINIHNWYWVSRGTIEKLTGYFPAFFRHVCPGKLTLLNQHAKGSRLPMRDTMLTLCMLSIRSTHTLSSPP
jgi:hypothetical protein